MPEIGTSGSMSGDGKRGVAEWPKLPRPSSTLPKLPPWSRDGAAAFGGITAARSVRRRGHLRHRLARLQNPEPQRRMLRRMVVSLA
jgi:hypothetical protein